MKNDAQSVGSESILDCLIVGAGPAGLTAALYLARFNRRFAVIDDGNSRAAWIPESHNLPAFFNGVSGREFLARQRRHAEKFGARIIDGKVTALRAGKGAFAARIESERRVAELCARMVLLATGAVDVEPSLPRLPDAVRRGLVRYCPICDGYEARGKKIAVLGHGGKGVGEAEFVARSYSRDVTLLTLGEVLNEDDRARMAHAGVTTVTDPIEALEIEKGRISALEIGGGEKLRFDVLYSALGLKRRSELAKAAGADCAENGAVMIDDHGRTSVNGLYAAGGVTPGLDQIVVAMGQAAIAATDIHNRSE